VLTIITQLKEVRDRLKAGEPVGAWEATLPIQQSLIDGARAVGIKTLTCTPAEKQEATDLLNECVSLCTTPSKEASATAIGDGTFLKLIFDLFLRLLPILFPTTP
jgi:hypothetical protein